MFTVIYDANVLFPAPLRDLLVRIAMKNVVRARWTELILDECFSSILKYKPELTKVRLQRTRNLMNRAVRDVVVTGFEPLIGGLSLPDRDDRHVLAAAIRAGAQTIVTFNLKDFPSSALAPFGIEAVHPDDFLLQVIRLAPGMVAATVNEQAHALRSPPVSLSELLETLSRQGLPQTVAKLHELFGTSA